MNKTKITAAACAVVGVAALTFLGVKFLPRGEETTAPQTEESVLEYSNTTLVPLAPAQTEILTPTTVKQPAEHTTRYDENASRLSQSNGWKDDKLTKGLPKINTGSVSTVNFVTDKGNRTVIRVDTISYEGYLSYINSLEKAGFTDNNGRAHIPDQAPSTVAMFYSRFDGERSFGVYWYGSDSDAGFDCEIVISDYDQAK